MRKVQQWGIAQTNFGHCENQVEDFDEAIIKANEDGKIGAESLTNAYQEYQNAVQMVKNAMANTDPNTKNGCFN